MRRPIAVGVLVLLASLSACSDDSATPGPPTVTAPTEEPEPAPEEPTDGPTISPSDERVRVVDTVATGLEAPWGLGFLPDGRAVVTERDTRQVLLIDPAGGEPQGLGALGEPVGEGDAGEGGLLGVAVSPDFAEDRFLYFYLSTASDNRVVRAPLDRQDRLGTPEVLLDGIPTGFIHDGGRLRFGPDGFLYVSTGETGTPELAPDRSSLAGKILRITAEGDPAPGNPDPDSPVWSWGHRNVQGLAFDDDGNLWASEFGQSTYDELNLIRKGSDYGWPVVEGRGDEEGLVNPRVVWRTDQASPSGLAHAEGHLWLGALQGTRLWRVDVADGEATDPTPFFVGEYGRLRTVEVAPDGRLWVTTSNRDGRGSPAPEDDRILVVTPGSD
ncbi:PQQ-dependent sugar dehydrogenase [Nocardioides euryhalodurans]|uniref:PQQ-dependent sugar dehydrogenase n=1 Tax=Nocardioides euryhalodurans TaxID=2518370 RepID=A0A4P7GQ74_9ACTN|nr:PQQ-dependent sugar dehydrogenase [Nocardioides euryhalodurans]QBR93977.1 PQQ-dependent sugar dehydrogenase [Nocardioides euryhalodurans]